MEQKDACFFSNNDYDCWQILVLLSTSDHLRKENASLTNRPYVLLQDLLQP
jgi:hypothetical protein